LNVLIGWSWWSSTDGTVCGDGHTIACWRLSVGQCAR